jgi:hypothetical protein
MADTENTSTESGGSSGGGNATHTALKAAAAAAATGAAAVAVKKALSSGSNGSGNGNGSEKSGSQSLVKSVASGSWDAAQDALVPLAADAAAAAGKYLAANGPDVVKEQIVPRFIDAFNEAS